MSDIYLCNDKYFKITDIVQDRVINAIEIKPINNFQKESTIYNDFQLNQSINNTTSFVEIKYQRN